MGRDIKQKDIDFEVMLAHKYDPSRIQNWRHIYVEPKKDGVRVIIIVKPAKESVAYYSRNGRKLYMFGHMDREVLKVVERAGEFYDDRFYEGAVLDGEMTSESDDFGAISGAIHRIDYTAFDARFFCFHAMPLSCFERGEDDKPQYRRSKMIAKIVKRGNLKLINHFGFEEVLNDEEVKEAYEQHRQEGYEGTMVKQMGQPWIAKRSHAWMKVKPEETYEIVIIGVKAGKGKYKGTLGALRYEHEGKECSTSGMSDKERDEWWELHKKGKLAGRMAEVKCAGVTKHGALRHPRFVRFRDDKVSLKKRTNKEVDNDHKTIARAADRTGKRGLPTETGRFSGKKPNKSNRPKEAA